MVLFLEVENNNSKILNKKLFDKKILEIFIEIKIEYNLLKNNNNVLIDY